MSQVRVLPGVPVANCEKPGRWRKELMLVTRIRTHYDWLERHFSIDDAQFPGSQGSKFMYRLCRNDQ